MAKKTCPSVAACLLIVLFAPPVHSPEAVGSFEPTLRISDTKPHPQRHHIDTPADKVVSARIDLPTDVTPLDWQFDAAALDQLIREGELVLPHPEGGEIQLTLVAFRTHEGTRTLRVRSDGYPGVITAEGNSFFATLATDRGVYAIEHQHGVTTLLDQRQLDLRNTQQDFQHVPAV